METGLGTRVAVNSPGLWDKVMFENRLIEEQSLNRVNYNY